MDDESLRNLLRSQQERETLQLLHQHQQQQQQQNVQPARQQLLDGQSILQQFNQRLGVPSSVSAAALLTRARSPVEGPALSVNGLDRLLANQRRASLLSSSSQTNPNPFAAAMRMPTSTTIGSMGCEVSSLAIDQEIKRLQQLQQQLASTGLRPSNPFLSMSHSPLSSSVTDSNSTLLQQYLMQKVQFPSAGLTSGAFGASTVSNAYLSTGTARTESTHESMLENWRLEEGRMLVRDKPGVDPTTFAAAASAKAPAPFHVPAYTEGSRKMRGGVIEPFPEKLHRLLREVEITGHSDVISFVLDGRAFAIHKNEAFFRDIVPFYFKQSRLSSFKRQLNLYGFELINNGPCRGAYYHELFQRDSPELCRRMRRVAVKVSAAKASANAGGDADKERSDCNSNSSEDEERKSARTSESMNL